MVQVFVTFASFELCFHEHTCDIFYDRLRRRELHLPTVLEAENIFQAELECLLGNKSDSQEHRDMDGDKSFIGMCDLTTVR